MLGIGVGTLIRNQVAALGYLYAGETLLMMTPGVRRLYPWLPGGAAAELNDFTAVSDALSQQVSADPVRLLSPAAGLLVLLACTALVGTAAVLGPMRRDIA